MTLPEEYEIDMTTGLPRKKRRRLPFSDPLEGILEEEGDEQQRPPKRPPISFTPEQRRKYGGVAPYLDLIKIPFEEYKRLYPRVSEYDLEDLYPEEFGKRKPPPELDLDDLLGNVFPNLRGTTGITTIKQMAEQDTEGFLAEIKRRGRTPDTEAVLRQYNVEPEEIFGQPPELEIETLVKQIWPETNVQNFVKFLTETPDQFIEAMQTGGRTKAKQDLLKELGFSWNDINMTFLDKPVVITVDGVRRQLTLTKEGQAFDDKGKLVASYNPISGKFAKPENALKDTVDAILYSSRQYWESFEGFALGVLPNIIYPEIDPKAYGGLGAFLNDTNTEMRDNFRWLYNENRREYEDWIKKNPDMAPDVKFQEGGLQHPELFKDPRYYAYEIANIVPFLIATTGIALATGGTGVPFFALSTAGMGAVEGGQLYQDLLDAGAPEGNAAQLALVAGGLIGGLESVGRIPLLRQVNPLLFKKFKQVAGKELAKRTMWEVAKKYGKNFTVSQFSEVATEVMQEVVSNAAVSVYDENRGILDNLGDIAVKTAVATLLPSGAGAGVSINPSIRADVDARISELGGKAKAIGKELAVGERGSIGGEVAKQPWQMTREDILKNTTRSKTASDTVDILGQRANLPGITMPNFTAREIAVEYHKRSIQQALSEGKPVPPEVLKDYPELAEKVKQVQKPAEITEPTPLEASELASLRRFKADMEKELTTATPEKAKELTRDLRTTEFRIRDLQEKVGKVTPAPEVTKQSIDEIMSVKHPQVDAFVSEREDSIKLHTIEVPKGVRRTGLGTAYMEDLIAYADETGKTITLSTGGRTGDIAKSKLISYYKNLGFVENKGRKKDYRISDTMYRRPALPKAPAGMPEAPASPELPVETAKPPVARPGVAEVAKAEVPPAPPVTPPPQAITPAPEGKTPVQKVREFYKAKIADLQVVTKDKIASLKDWAKYTVEEKSRVQNILTDYIQEQLPLAERGKLLDAVKNIKSQEQLDETLARVDSIAETSEQKRLRIQIIKELKRARPRKVEGIVKGRFGGDMQTELDIMNRTLKMTRDEALAKIAANQQSYEDGKMSYEDMILDNSRLSFAGIEGMTATELQETLDYIKSLKEVGRATRLQEIEKWHEGIDTARKDITRVVTGGKEVEPGVVKEFTGLQSLLKRVEGGQVALTDFLDILSGTDKTSKPYSSPLNHFVDDRVIKSYNSEQEGMEATRQKVSENFKRVFNITKDRDANDVLRQIGREKVNLGTFKNTEGKDVKLELTKGQMIDAYNLMQAKENLPTFVEGNKFTPEMQDAITKGLSPQEKAWADWQREFLADYWSGINSVYEPLYGLKLGRNENYWPRNRDIERSDVPEHILIQEDYNHFASVTNGSLKARTQNKIPFKFLDANAKLIQHVTQMEHFKAWAFTIRDLRSVFMSRDIKNAIHQFHGRDIAGKIDDYISVLARGGIEKAKRVHILDTLRGNVAVAVLGIKPMIAIKQPTALLAYATEMPYSDFVTGVVDFLKNPIANYRTLHEKSAGLRARYRAGQYERDIKVGVEGGAPRNISGKATWKENVLTLIQMGDKFGTVPGMWAKYKSELKAGATDAQAILEAEKLTNRSQNTSQLFTLTTIQHGGSWARLATMFQDQPNKYFRLINSNFRNMINGRQGKAKSIANIALLWVVMPVLFQWMSDAFRWRPERQLRAAALGPINQLLIFGQMAQSVVGWLSGEKYPYEPSPVLQIADDVRAAISKMEKLIRDGSDPFKEVSMDDVIEMIENFVKAAGMTTGVPTPYLVQLEKAARGQKGKRDWRELLFSRWALEEPKPDLKGQAEDEGLKLGLEKEVTGEAAADKKPEIYDTRDYFTKLKSIFSKTLPSDITEKNGFDKRSVEFGKALIAEDESSSQPNKPLYKIVDDIEKDESVNYSVMQHYLDWQARLKIDSLAKLKEYDATHPRAFLGNLTQSQLALLLQYESKSKQDRKKFLEDHPELNINPRTEWLKSHPKENAQLAIWGQAKIMSQEAYNEAKTLIKTLDIPDSALPEFTMPPEKSVKNYFDYQDMVGDDKSNSWEAQLLLAKDDDLRKWLEREPIETPIASLELKTIPKYHEIDDKLNKDTDPDWIGNLDDKVKDANGLTARDRARVALMDTKIPGTDLTYRDMERKVKAIELGTNEKPTDTKLVDAHVAYMRLQDAPGVGPNTAEVELAKIDQAGDIPKLNAYGQWRLDNKLDKEAPDFTRVPIWNIDAKYRKEDAAYQTILDKYEGSDETAEAKAYLAGNDDYRKDRRRRQAYKLTNSKTGEAFPRDQVENFVTYNEYEEKGFRQKRMLLEDPAFAKAMHEIKGKDIPDPKTVPAVQYDDIYDQYKTQFDKLDEVAEIDVAEPGLTLDQTREKARNALRYDAKGSLTDFGKAEIERNGYKTLIGKEEHIDNWNELYSLPESGFRRDRLLKDNPDFYKQVWLGIMKNDTKKFNKVPDVEYDNLYDEFKEQFDKWDAYGEPKNKKLYIADPDERRIMREILLRENSDFADARIKQTAYSLLIGNEKYVPEYVEYEKKLAEGKPKGAAIWYADDRYLKEHQGFYRKMRELGYWTQDVDFDKIPTEKFEGLYNTQYTQLETNKPRRAFRATNPWFDDEGAKLGFWKALDEKERTALLTGGPYTRPPSLDLGELDEILKKPILKVK